ncbi:HAL/PAL/TAL family ammonia-lyase [Microbulbifer rhizosphaerae]|uniref:tyrosine ammonia-lyase n=1 Tax=Microbulbifer rhizosphaerae TaxID=1562603 RepID=A0A7W4WFR9_9GAMM|nr:aromatic amino acid ammonia-lyase [Microbulbifer rhizosphaerae]MBB3062858.1 histidine ammonia-lyase [Microbulbifer rhizosphaerae]
MNTAVLQRTPVLFDGSELSVEQVDAIARGRAAVQLSDDESFVARINRGVEFLDRLWQQEGVIYGVTTGYGDSCTVNIPGELVEKLPRHLYTFHGCGLGEVFTLEQSRAVVAARLASLARGSSGVRYELLQQLARLLQQDVIPVIPQEGSVGASGDLTPLSYVAAVVAGERKVWFKGEQRPTAEVFDELRIAPLKLRPKEGLAIMNGTAVMTGLACLAYRRAEYLCQLSARITALMSVALQGNAYHFDNALFAVKPHPGQNRIARWIHDDLNVGEAPRQSSRLQDRYSLRCAPHVIGVVQDSLPWLRQFIENELNSANDNPIIDGENEHVLHGGHFYGGHIAFAMDSLKNAVANLADLLDRQIAQLVDVKFNNGLPANLTGAEGERRPLNHGFKAVQIGASAWTAEALKQTMPASVFSRSTECHNQDKVSMGTIAARDCLRVLQLTEQVAAAALMMSWQGVQLRLRAGGVEEDGLSPALRASLRQVADNFALLEEDRELESDLRNFVQLIQQKHWRLYDDC